MSTTLRLYTDFVCPFCFIAEESTVPRLLREFDLELAHWRKSQNLEDDGVLRALASAAGLDPDTALAAADSPVYLERVDARQAQAKRQGVSGIPTLILGDHWIVGCQSFEVLARAAERAGIPRR